MTCPESGCDHGVERNMLAVGEDEIVKIYLNVTSRSEVGVEDSKRPLLTRNGIDLGYMARHLCAGGDDKAVECINRLHQPASESLPCLFDADLFLQRNLERRTPGYCQSDGLGADRTRRGRGGVLCAGPAQAHEE